MRVTMQGGKDKEAVEMCEQTCNGKKVVDERKRGKKDEIRIRKMREKWWRCVRKLVEEMRLVVGRSEACKSRLG